MEERLNLVTAVAGVIALLTPALAVVVRLVALSVTAGVGPSIHLAVSFPVTELTFLGLVELIPYLAIIVVAVVIAPRLAKLTNNDDVKIRIVGTLVVAGLIVLLLPPFPASLLEAGGWIIAVYLLHEVSEPDFSWPKILLPAVGLVIALGFGFGLTYGGGHADHYAFDHTAVANVEDGEFAREAVDDDFFFLLQCRQPGGLVAVPRGAVSSIVLGSRGADLGYSLFGILFQGERLNWGLRPGCG